MSLKNGGPRLLESNSLVRDWRADQRGIVDCMGGLGVRVVMLRDGIGRTDGSAESFNQRVTTHGVQVNASVMSHREPQHNIARRLRWLATDPSVDGVLLARPLPAGDGFMWALDPRQDIDRAGPHSKYRPALMTGMFHLVGRTLPDLAERSIVVAGAGGTVGSQIMEELAERGITATGIDPKFGHTDDDLRTAIGEADTLFTAMRQPGKLDEAWLHDGMTVFDATVEPVGVDGRTQMQGDVHRRVYDSEMDITLNRVPGVIGPLATCGLYDNAIDAARLRMNTG